MENGTDNETNEAMSIDDLLKNHAAKKAEDEKKAQAEKEEKEKRTRKKM